MITKPNFVFIRNNDGRDSYTTSSSVWGREIEFAYLQEILEDEVNYLSLDFKSLSKEKRNLDIICYSSNYRSYEDVKYMINKFNPKVLMHFSDEWGNKQSYEQLFKNINLVYRQNRFKTYINPKNVKIIPVGYHAWDQHYFKEFKKIKDRKYTWCFIGAMKDKRKRNTNILKKNFSHFFCKPTDGYNSNNNEIYNDSIFGYCPPGNNIKHSESNRQYSCPVNGCIPIIHCSKDTFKEVYGHFDIVPQFPHFEKIKGIVKYIKYMLNHPKKILKLQKTLNKWHFDIQKVIKTNILKSCVVNLK